MDAYREIDDLIKRVRARWRGLVALRAGAVAAVGIAVVFAIALLVARWTGHSPVGLATTGVATFLAALAVLLLVVWPIRRAPTDAQVARFIEEQEPSLDDRLVSAVDVATTAQAVDANTTTVPSGEYGALAFSGVAILATSGPVWVECIATVQATGPFTSARLTATTAADVISLP